MQDSKKIRQNLQRKIRMQQQKMSEKSSSLLSGVEMTNELLKKFSDLDLSLQENGSMMMEKSEGGSRVGSEKFTKNDNNQNPKNKSQMQQKWEQIRKQQQKIGQMQKEMDFYRRQMLHLTQSQEQIKLCQQQEKLKTQQTIQSMTTHHKSTIQKLKHEQQLKIQQCLKKIQQLIQQKSQFNRECQKYRLEEKKMEKMLKEQGERYRHEMKNAKEAFGVLEKQKRVKWEKERIIQLKEQAITETEPRILEIIKQSNLDIKNAQKVCIQKWQQYQRQVKQKQQKEFYLLKKRLFNQQQQQKQRLRVDQSSKANIRYQQMQRQFSVDRQKMRQQYNRQVSQLQSKIRKQIQEFIYKNKQSHQGNLEQIRRLREGYEQRIRKMRQGVEQRLQLGAKQVQEKYFNRHQQTLLQLEAQNQGKYLKAEQKIKHQINKRMQKITNQVQTMKADYREQVNKDFDSKMDQHQQTILQQKRNLTKAIDDLEQKIIIQHNKVDNQKHRLKQMANQIQKTQNSNYIINKRISQYQSQLLSLDHCHQSTETQLQQKLSHLQSQLKHRYQSIRSRILALQQSKHTKQNQLIHLYVAQQKRLDQQMKSYKQDIQANLDKRINEICKLKHEIQNLQTANQQKKNSLDDQRKLIQ